MKKLLVKIKGATKKLIFKIISLAFFVVPPVYFVFSYSASASIFSLIGVSGCILLIIAWSIFSRFFMGKLLIDKINNKISIWSADLEKANELLKQKEYIETESAKQEAMINRKLIGRYNNYLLALKLPLPTLVIVGLIVFLFAVEQAAANLAATLGICSCFWVVGIVLLFVSNIKRIKKEKSDGQSDRESD